MFWNLYHLSGETLFGRTLVAFSSNWLWSSFQVAVL